MGSTTRKVEYVQLEVDSRLKKVIVTSTLLDLQSELYLSIILDVPGHLSGGPLHHDSWAHAC